MKEIDLIICIKTALLMDEADTRLQEAAIAVDGSVIVDVGKKDELLLNYTASKTIDAASSLAMPGLVNTHTHAAMTCFRGIADDLALMDWLTSLSKDH